MHWWNSSVASRRHGVLVVAKIQLYVKSLQSCKHNRLLYYRLLLSCIKAWKTCEGRENYPFHGQRYSQWLLNAHIEIIFVSCMFFSSQLHQCCRRTSQLLLALCSWRPRLWMKHGRRPLHVRNRVCQGRLPRHWLIPHHQSWDHSRTLVALFGKDFFWFSASLNVNIFWDKTLLGLMERSPQVMSITSIKKQFLGR